MSTDVAVPKFRSRPEGDGHIIFVLDSGLYLHANEPAHIALEHLYHSGLSQEADAAVAMDLVVSEEEARGILAQIVQVLSGELGKLDNDEVGGLLIRPLSDAVDNAERCETFGMPL